MKEKTVWIIRVKGKEMEENFKKIVEEGVSLDETLSKELSRKIPSAEEFIKDRKVRFWRFVKGRRDWIFPKYGDYIFFEIEKENITYITISSDTIKDQYDKNTKNYKILQSPNPVIYNPKYRNYTKFSNAFLVKILKTVPERLSERLRNECDCKDFSRSLIYCEKCPEKIIDHILSTNHGKDEKTNKIKHRKGSILSEYLNSRGYLYPSHLISQFYVALKTKGFVILSGLTGTGKTKIALEFAELLEMPHVIGASGPVFDSSKEISTLNDYIKDKGFAIYGWSVKGTEGTLAKVEPPFVLWIYSSKSSNDKAKGKVPFGLLVTEIRRNTSYEKSPKDWKERFTWIREVYGEEEFIKSTKNDKVFMKVSKVIDCVPPIEIEKFHNMNEEKLSQVSPGGLSLVRLQDECLRLVSPYIFLPVRPDWRDSKALLGYYNPLDGRYYKTQLLEFIIRAIEDYEQNREKAMPYFILLDEMNLAHVEYYFADFLSVLESGRDDGGFTREGIKLHDVDEIETFDGIPKEFHLPPNLYIIGTVNMDETTYSFSPKVLDRAFTIEFHDVELDGYPPEKTELSQEELEKLRKKVLDDLRNGGKFLTVYKKGKGDQEKGDIEKALEELKNANNGKYWEILKQLNSALKPYDLHFGYRVVDEIALFLQNAKESRKKGIVEFKDEDEIFDLALLMKVLPKFHGNRRKLEKPLLIALKMAKEGKLNGNEAKKKAEELWNELFGERTSSNRVETIVREMENTEDYTYKHTAKKVLRMLRQLYEIGFTSFS